MKHNSIRALDCGNMSLKDQFKLELELRKYKYQVKIKDRDGKIRFIHSNEKEAVEAYVIISKAKMIWIKES